MRVHYLQHAPFEGPASIAGWVRRRGHTLAATKLFQDQALPGIEDFDWLVVLGGPMGVQDESPHPWLKEEKKLLERTVRAGKPVLGVCLGAQLLAHVLGAKVYRNGHQETGWFPVRRASGTLFPARFTAFHWHGDTFDLPTGAVHLAASDGCRNQAFECGLAWGLQFHLEVTPSSVRALIQNCSADIGSGPFEQSADEMLRDPSRFFTLRPLLDGALDCIQERVAH